MTREKFKLISGVPFICTLETPEARPFSSRFHEGQEWLYNVEHRNAQGMLYLPVEGHQAIQRLGAKAGDEIQLLKTQTQGQAPAFVARFVSDATLAVPAFAPDPNRSAPDAFDRHMQQQQGVRLLAPEPARSVPPQQPYTSGAAAPQFAPQTQSANGAPSPASVMLAQCLMQALDAALGLEHYAASKGRALTFAPEDIRAMGLSVYIGKQREGR